MAESILKARLHLWLCGCNTAAVPVKNSTDSPRPRASGFQLLAGKFVELLQDRFIGGIERQRSPVCHNGCVLVLDLLPEAVCIIRMRLPARRKQQGNGGNEDQFF